MSKSIKLELGILLNEMNLVFNEYKDTYDKYSLINNNNNSLKEYKGVELLGGTVYSVSHTNESNQCTALCSNDNSCIGANYRKNDNSCSLNKTNDNLDVASSLNNVAIINEKLYLLIRLRQLNEKLTSLFTQTNNLVKSSTPITQQEEEEKDKQLDDLYKEELKLIIEKKQLNELIEKNNNLLNEYNSTSNIVKQSNLIYFFWTLIAIIIVFIFIKYVIYNK